MQKAIPLNPFTNVVQTGTAICDLANLLGHSIEAINLSFTNITKAQITSIVLRANNKVIFETDGSKLDSAELFKGWMVSNDAGRLSINFTEVMARTPNAFIAGAIDTSPQSGIVSLRLEVTTSGAAASPTLTGWAELSPAIAVPGEEALRALMRRRHRAVQTIGAANVKVALTMPHIDPSGGGSLYTRFFIYSANLTAIQLVRNGVTLFDLSRNDLNFMQIKSKRSPQAGMTVLDFIQDNVIGGRMFDSRPAAGTQTAILYGTFSATETITMETEELLPLGVY